MTTEEFKELNRLFVSKLTENPMSKTHEAQKEKRKPKTAAKKKGGKGGRKGC